MMNIYQAIAGIMRKGAVVGKDKQNLQQRFNYRGIDDVMNVFQPLMAEAGIFLVPEVLESTREERQTKQGGNLIYSVLKVRYTFFAEDGSSVSATVVGEGMDSGDKASNKAMAAAMKYAMFQTFCIPTEEMKDPDAETPPANRPAAPAAQPPKVTQFPREVPPPDLNMYGEYVCDECGQVIKPWIKEDGSVRMTAEQIAKMSIAEFSGKQLCRACGNKRMRARE